MIPGRERAATRRLILMALPVGLVLVIAAGLAWRAERAARAHRSALERVVRDHADFAAFLLHRVAIDALDRRALYAFTAILRHAPGSPLPEPSALDADPFETARCPLAGGGRLWARWTAHDGALALAGAPVDAGTRTWLADTLPVLAQMPGSDRLRHAHRAGPGEPAMLTYTVLRDSTRGARAVYATNGCFTVDDGTAFDEALATTRALPPSLTAGLPNDSLLALTATAPGGRVLHASRPPWLAEEAGMSATGHAAPDTLRDGVAVQVTLRPAAAARLMAGGMPEPQRAPALLLLALAAGLGVFTILQARRYLALVRTRERFMRDVSHELRTPLQQILLNADLLRLDRLPDDAARRAAADSIEVETRRLIHMVNAVLRFARPAPVHAMAREPLALAGPVHDAIAAFEPLSRDRGVRFRTELDAAARAPIAADDVRQILVNLLDNAVKFGPQGQTVTVRVARADGRVVLTVDDEGPGIPSGERRAVFDAYHRLARHAHDVPGSGIGLTIVAELARASGATAAVEDAPGGGARLRVTWPAGSAP